MQRPNVRYLTQETIPEPLDFGSVDVSFISLKLILPALRPLMKDSGHLVCLIKPQFEAGKAAVGKKGVVRDPAIHKRVLDDFLQLASQLDFTVLGLTFSPVRGPEGNIEFLAHLTRKKQESKQIDTGSVVRLAHETLKV
jgi:23S rRNA (cytidine1920-2'-O)/16S rRNA (cytidine1409-2'-O)-methyltransferase